MKRKYKNIIIPYAIFGEYGIEYIYKDNPLPKETQLLDFISVAYLLSII